MPNIKPTEPKWATDQTGAPNFVAPTGTEETDGFPAASIPVRGTTNAVLKRLWAFVLWLSTAWLHWNDFDGDESDGGGWARSSTITDPITTTGTLTGTSGAAAGHFNGRRFVVTNAAKVYTASKDTYVDTDNEGTLTYTEVANGAGAPALGAGKFRLFMVETDGTEITDVTRLANEYVRFSSVVSFKWATVFRAGLQSSGGSWDIGTSGVRFGTAWLDDLDVSGDFLLGGNVNVGNNLEVDGVTSLNDVFLNGDVTMAPEGTYKRTIPASAFSGDIDFGGTDLPKWALEANSDDPSQVSQYFVRTGVAAATKATCKAPLLGLPDGAVITDVSILSDVTAGTVRAAVIRKPIASVAAGTNLSATDDTTGETLPSGAALTALAMDASAGIRTIDYSAYTYEVWIRAQASATIRVYAVYVEAEVESPLR